MIWRRMAGLALLLAGTAPVFAQAPLPPTLTPSKTPLTTAVAPIPGASTGGVTDPAANYLAPGVQPDLAFGAFQRGYYLTALRQAMKRIEADSNDAPAMALMGELYRDGLGLRRNLEEATRWYRLAADRGDPPAAFALALAYLQGQGVQQDVKAAIPWLELAAAPARGRWEGDPREMGGGRGSARKWERGKGERESAEGASVDWRRVIEAIPAAR